MTPEELDKYINDRRAARGLPPITPSAATPVSKPAVTTKSPAVEKRQAQSKETGAVLDIEKDEDKLRKEIRQQLMREGMSLVDVEFEPEVERRIQERRQPPYIGGFIGPVVPYTAPLAIAPAASLQPINVPAPPLTTFDVLRPQTRVPEVVAIRAAENPFDDVQFEKSLKGLEDAEKRQKRASYKGFKDAYKKLRDLNPNVNTEEILSDLDRQLKELPDALSGKKKTKTQDPRAELGIANDPVAIALSRQTVAGTVPTLEPGQLAFLSGVYQSELPIVQSEDRARLAVKGAKPIMEKRQRPSGERGPGGRPIMEEYEVQVGKADYTPKEIDDIIANKTKKGEYDARPWWANEAERTKILADPEKYAKGGFLFQKEYLTGATVESPVSYTLRSAMTVPNVIAGAVGYALTPAETQRAKEADRPEKFRESGLGANILSNVATSGGYTKELGDAFKYNPDPSIREYETAARVVGFGIDILGFADIGLVAGAVGGTKAGVQFGRAAAAAGEGFGAASRASAKAALRGGVSSWADSVPGLGKLATKFEPGDVRLIYGAKLGDEFQAGSRYTSVFKEAVDAGQTADEAHRLASKAVKQSATDVFNDAIRAGMSDADARAASSSFADFSKTKVADDVDKLGPRAYDMMTDTGKGSYWAKGAAEFSHADDVARATSELERGVAVADAERIVKPYLSAAAKSDKRIASAIAKAFEDVPRGTKVKAAAIFDNLSDAGKAAFGKAIRSTASFEQGAKVMDTQLAGVFDGGAPTIALTPRTLTTQAEAGKIVDAYKKTGFFTRVVEPLQRGDVVNVASGTRVVDGYQVGGREAQGRLRQSISTSRASGAITAADEARILKNLDQGVVAADDLRLLAYSEVDAIAAGSKAGLTKTALAEVGKKPSKVPVGSTRAKMIAQEQRLGEIQSALPVVFSRAKNRIIAGLSDIGGEITSVQRQMISDAKGKISALDRVLRDDLARMSTDPEFAALYGVAVDAPTSVKLIALGQGVVGGGGQRVYAEQFLEGLVYGTKKNKLVNAFRPEYQYGESVLGSSREWNALVSDVSKMSPAELDSKLLNGYYDASGNYRESIFDQAKSIVQNNVNTSITDVGGRVLSVPKELTVEALAVAYARVKANEIVAETATKLLPERPIALGVDSQFIIRLGGNRKIGEKAFYRMVQEYAQNPRIFESLAAGSFADVDTFVQKVLSGIDSVKDLTPAQVSSLRSYLRAELIAGSQNRVGSIIDDVIEQVDIMRDFGMLENRKMEEFIDRVGDLMKGKISPNNLILPSVATELQRMIGTEAKYQETLKELARLSDLAEDGNVSAIRASRTIRSMIDSYNSFYYYGMLSLSPRFHGVNNLTAPLITYYTTGRVANPFRAPEAANVMLLGSPAMRSAIARNKVVVTDRLGNNYTRGQLFDLAVKNGIFKSQINTEVAGNFIEEANAIVGNLSTGEKVRRGVFTAPRELLGDPLAAFTDNVWRMESMIVSIRNGSTIEDAIQIGRKSLFDYGDLTEAERFISRNFFVFYNYFRQSIVQGMTNVFSNPGRMIRLMRGATQPSRIMIGEENYQDLAYYFPQDAATGRMVSALEPAAQAKEGVFVQFPMLPHADALKIAAGVLTDPIGFAIGPAPITEAGRREYTEGFIAARLGPLTKASGLLLFNDTPLTNMLEIRMKKNRIPPEHVAAWDALLPDGGRDAILSYFGAEVKDVSKEGGENAYGGKIYVLDDDGFARYQAWLTAAQMTGTVRSFNDWSKIVGGAQLSGAYPQTNWQRFASFSGVQTYSSAALEVVTSERYLEDRARLIKKEAGTMKRERLPQKEADKK